jgi:hypothetical protein
VDWCGGKGLLADFGAIIMAGSIVLSLSRGGTIAVLSELVILFLIVSRTQRGALARTRIFFACNDTSGISGCHRFICNVETSLLMPPTTITFKCLWKRD